MKTKKCKYCGEEVAKNAKRCPKCGGKLAVNPIVAIILFLILVPIVYNVAMKISGGREYVDSQLNNSDDNSNYTDDSTDYTDYSGSTDYITQSRKKTLVDSIQSYISAATVAINDWEFGSMSDSSKSYYIPVNNNSSKSCIDLAKGGIDPFGEWDEAYVVVNYDPNNYSFNYYFTFRDKAGYGMELTKSDDISYSGEDIKNPAPSKVSYDEIKKQKAGTGTENWILDAYSCKVSEVTASNKISIK